MQIACFSLFSIPGRRTGPYDSSSLLHRKREIEERVFPIPLRDWESLPELLVILEIHKAPPGTGGA